MQNRPLGAEISIDRLLHNYRLLRSAAGDAGLIAVVKANAYGHGVAACASALAAAGAGWLGVTCVQEGVALRAACPQARILLMSGIWQHEADAAIEHGLTPVVWEPVHLDWLEAAAQKQRAHSIPVHLEIDTGMSRQGVQLAGLPALLGKFRVTSSLAIEGVMTHFHSPELLDTNATAAQLEKFRAALEVIASHGFQPGIIHAGNSASVLTAGGASRVVDLAKIYGASAMLRPGLALYGYAPRFSGEGALPAAQELKPVLAWKTRVVSLRTIEAGETAGYCATFRAKRRSRLALLPAGYADGLNRLLSNRGEVLVRGQRAPIVGRISMDLGIVDITDVEGVELGDEVVLIGEQSAQKITAYEHADLAQTIPYEILCNISARVPRVTVDARKDHA